MMQKCIWCNAVRDLDASPKAHEEETVAEYVNRRYGPLGCSAPDGDGHVWWNYDPATGKSSPRGDPNVQPS